MNYIGIRGHRGAGKNSISYLLGNTLEYINQVGDPELSGNLFEHDYNHWCDTLMKSENCINEISLTHVYFDSFSDSIKLFIKLILGCPDEYVYEDKYKDLIVINLKDLSYKPLSEFEKEPKLKTANEVYKLMPFNSDEKPTKLYNDHYMKLSEFIMYFGFEVMQRFFGKNIWVKIMQSNSSVYDGFFEEMSDQIYYKIFSDIKAHAEETFIRNNNGVIVKIMRPGHKKGGSKLQDELMTDCDFSIIIDGDLYSIKDKIINLAKNINDKFKQKYGKN